MGFREVVRGLVSPTPFTDSCGGPMGPILAKEGTETGMMVRQTLPFHNCMAAADSAVVLLELNVQ